MQVSRRQLLQAGAVASAALAFGTTPRPVSAAQASASGNFKTQLYKSLISDDPTEEYCAALKDAGYDGIEVTGEKCWNAPAEKAWASRAIAEKYGLRIHSVMRGWAELNNPDADKRKASMETIVRALESAAAYGADAVLLVPCRVGGMAMPEAWDFDVDFDPKTLQVKTVAAGDNAPYADYIKAQNDSTTLAGAAIRELIPVAAKVGVRIAVENVWNNLWCTPDFFAAFVNSFDSTWVSSYFDLGNHTKYSRAERWIEALGSNIVKLHIKGFKVNEVKGKFGGGPGDWCAVDKANIDWKSVRATLEKVGYNGYVSVEEGHYDPAGYSKVLDTFFNGGDYT